MLVEWIAYLQLEPFGDDKADIRGTWHTAHVLNVLTSEEFEITSEVLEDLTPTYWKEPDAEPVTVTQHAESLHQTILTHFAN